jgi:flavin-binding protein dodecin
MAKQAGSAESIYKIVEVIGTSTKSWDDAAKNAVETAAGTLRDLRIAEIVKLDMKVEDGKVRAYRARVALSFKYESWNSDQGLNFCRFVENRPVANGIGQGRAANGTKVWWTTGGIAGKKGTDAMRCVQRIAHPHIQLKVWFYAIR